MGDFKTLRSGSVCFGAQASWTAGQTDLSFSFAPVLLTFESVGSKASKTHTVAVRLKKIRWMANAESAGTANTGNVNNVVIEQFLFGSEGGALSPVAGAITAVFVNVYAAMFGNAGFGHAFRSINNFTNGPDALHPLVPVMNMNPIDTDLGGRIWPFWELWAFLQARAVPSGMTMTTQVYNMGELFYDYVEIPNMVFQQIVQEQAQQTVKEIRTGVII